MKKVTEVAREKFKESGLSYDDLGIEEMNMLRECIEQRLAVFENGSFTMRLKPTRLKDKKIVNGKIQKYFFRVKAYYFDDREAISFNDGGFIGFAGWADSTNVQPFVDAFNNWLEKVKQGANV